MTEADLLRIEAALDLRLPPAYRRALRAYPVPACAGNADTPLWDAADPLIALNQALRTGGRPWPRHWFALGDGGDGSPCVIDLDTPGPAVWWMDRCQPDGPGSGRTHDAFDDWLADCVADLRADCEADGIDPDGTPQAHAAAREASARQSMGCLLAGGAAAALVALAWAWRG